MGGQMRQQDLGSVARYRGAENVQNLFSNSTKAASSFHCSRARSFAVRNSAQAFDGFPGTLAAHAATGRNVSFVEAHRLFPGRKLCSRLWRSEERRVGKE